jgi:hypothetical protein
MDKLDLSQLSYEELVTFFFDRAAPDPSDHTPSFSDEGAECEWSRPEVAVRFLTRMCLSFGDICRKYSLGQVNQAIWMTIGFDFELVKYLWDNSVPLGERLECIRSMYIVYSDFVAKSDLEIMENCFDMWWDLMAGSFWFQPDFFDHSEIHKGKSSMKLQRGETSKLDSDSRALLDAMFETLGRILELPDRRAQKYALHGLGHLHHPGVHDLVQKHIDSNRADLTDSGLKWIEQCRDGSVM